jgi:hypothetical protein
MQVQPNKDDIFPQHVETGLKGFTGCGTRLEFKKKIPKIVPQGLKPH